MKVLDLNHIFALVAIISGVIVPFLIYFLGKKQKKIEYLEENEFTVDWPRSLKEDMIKSNTYWFYGIHLYGTIDHYYNLFIERARSGAKFRFIFADPQGHVFEMVKLRYHGDNSPDREMATSSIELIKKFKAEFPDKVELKVIDYLFSRTVYILDPDMQHGRAYVSQHTFRLGGEKSKARYKKGRGYHFDFILREYEKIWDRAISIS